MPYTNPWSNLVPPGTEQAKNIDDHIRRVRLDLAERLLTVFEDLDDDPLIFTAALLGTLGGGIRSIILSAAAFESNGNSHPSEFTPTGAGAVGQFYADGGEYIAAVPVPTGYTIKFVELMGEIGDTSGIYARLYKRPFIAGGAINGGASLVATTATMNTSGVQVVSTGEITSDVTDSDYFFIRLLSTSAGADRYYVHAVKVIYEPTVA